MYCPQCGYQVSNDWRACANCGEALDQKPATTRDIGVSAHPPSVIGESANNGPSAWFYGLGVALIIIPFLLVIALLVAEIIASNPDMRFVVPGAQELNFNADGKYTLYHEYQSTVDGKGYSTEEYLKDVKVTLKSKNNFRKVHLSSSSSNMSYEFGSRAGKSLYEFEIEEPGIYILAVEYQDGASTPKTVFAVGPYFDVLGLTLLVFGVGSGGFVLGAIIVLWIFLKRRKVRNEWGTMYSSHQMADRVSPKSRLAVVLLVWFLGPFGIHRFYLEKIGTGILMLITFGGFGIWVLVDFIIAVCGEMKDKDGRLITRW